MTPVPIALGVPKYTPEGALNMTTVGPSTSLEAPSGTISVGQPRFQS
jgi:hypothetical protein